MVTQQQWERAEGLLVTGLSISEVCQRVGLSYKTIYRLRRIGGPKVANKPDHQTPKVLRKYADYIDLRLRQNLRNATKLFSELKDRGFTGKYYMVNNYLNSKIKDRFHTRGFKTYSYKSSYKPAKRYETDPGQQALVDWTYIRRVNFNGKPEKLYCFAYILGNSRMRYFEFTLRQNLFTLIQCQIRAFEKLGMPKEVVYDNMKSVVTEIMRSPNGIQAKRLNPLLEDFAKYYGFEITTNAPYWPRAKGKVERAIGYMKGNFLQGIKISKNLKSLDQLNKQIQDWSDTVGNIKPNETTKERPADRWLREKPFLTFPTNVPVYQVTLPQSRRVDKDGTVNFKSCVYPIPQEYCRKKVDAKITNQNGLSVLEFSHEGVLIAKYYLATERYKRLKENEAIFFKSSPQKKIIRKIYPKITKSNKRSYLIISRRPISYYNKIFFGKS